MSFPNPLLDFAIGLIAFFLSASLIVTALQEAIAQLVNMRARDLRKRISEMMEGGSEGEPKIENFFEHPLIAALNTRSDKIGPSYIPRDIFTKVVKDLYLAGQAGAALIGAARGLDANGSLMRRSLRTLALQTTDDLTAYDKALGDWFDGVMDRLSGLYKRYVQLYLFLLGLLVAAAGNLDTLSVGAFLANTPAARESMAASIGERMKSFGAEGKFDEPSQKKLLTDLEGLLKKSEVPMGWTKDQVALFFTKETWSNLWDQLKNNFLDTIGRVLSRLPGWLLTALAVMLGSAFWFDTLKRFVNIRAAGPIRKLAG